MIKIPPTANIQVPAPPVLGKLNPLGLTIVVTATDPSPISTSPRTSVGNSVFSFPVVKIYFTSVTASLPSSSTPIVSTTSYCIWPSGIIYPLGAFVSTNAYVPASKPIK